MLNRKEIIDLAAFAISASALAAADPNEDDFECLPFLEIQDTFLATRKDTWTTEVTSTYVLTVVEQITAEPLPSTTMCDGGPRLIGGYPDTSHVVTQTFDPP